MSNLESQDHINNLEQRLYKRDAGPFKIPRTKYDPVEEKAPGAWEHSDLESELEEKKRNSILLYFFWGSLFFFLIAIGAGVYFWVGGINIVSNDNIDIGIVGPSSIRAGDELSFITTVTNRNRKPIDNAEIVFEYPGGTRKSQDITSDYLRSRGYFGTLPSGESRKVVEKSVLFGEQNTAKDIHITVHYTIAGSSHIYEKEKDYSLAISSSPINVTIDTLPEINTNREVLLTAKFVSNSDTLLHNVMVIGSYPTGFVFRSASAEPSTGKNTWRIGDLKPGEEKTLTIKGVMIGQDGDQKSFQFTAGTESDTKAGTVAVVYGQALNTVTVHKPFVTLDLSLNGSASPQVSSPSNKDIEGTIEWQNTLNDLVADSKLTMTLSGAVLDVTKVRPSNGFYNSNDNTIVWDNNSLPILKQLEPGKTGSVRLVIKSVPLVTDGKSPFKNPTISLKLNLTGNRVSKGFTNDKIDTTIERLIKIDTQLVLEDVSNYADSLLVNSGPIPPAVGKETVYTVTWTVRNSSNLTKQTTLNAVLPPYMKWVGQSTPESEDISYNSRLGQIIWNLDDVAAGSGFDAAARQVSFQVSLTPSLTQVGASPMLVSDTTLTGVDSFTGNTITVTSKGVTTKTEDEASEDGDQRVIK